MIDVASRRLRSATIGSYGGTMARLLDPPSRRWPPWLANGVLGAAVTVVMALVITANHGGRQDPDVLAYLWALGLGGLVLARRRHPILVLAISVLGLFAYYIAGYPAVGVAVPIAAALFSAAEFGHPVAAVVAGVITVGASVTFRLLEGEPVSLVLGYELAGHVLLVAAAIATGDGVRARRALLARTEELVALAAVRAEQEVEMSVQAERIALARDLHDSLGHAASVVAIHADVAREAVARHDDAAATTALAVIKEATSTSLVELRRTVAVLRRAGGPAPSPLGLADLTVAVNHGPGLRVVTSIEASDLPPVVDAAAARIIQESLTNVARHSGAREAFVSVAVEAGVLVIEVRDDGPTREPDSRADSRQDGIDRTGHGITGMRERATALGGSLDADHLPDGGFVVRARIPLAGPS